MQPNDNMMGALVGPGSQPADFDGGKLEYMKMPAGMTTFSASHVPEADEAQDHPDGMAAAEAILSALKREGPSRIDLSGLAAEDLAFIDQLLGEGEVSVVAGSHTQAQESVLAGVWRVRGYSEEGVRIADYAEIAAFPTALLTSAFEGAKGKLTMPESAGPNIFNAPPLVAEINDHIDGADADGADPHVINLSLLPHTEEDLVFLDKLMGEGELIILSRGYGNCRIRATRTRNCWWVRYYNSQDTLILNSIEISRIPEVALAADVDIADSAERLSEIMETYR
ncbi:hydrogenase expression/formation protein [Croceicoccus gelatinilyticus]|uniref:hydrogenase expression/formation protein n=1 Tax=Croceicoccus gelatinilyticus TaxID=2835536 RepID=UPI001BCC46BC|nr:hydrogenase expression/formation protein [Croceicoccus gelatinilyticus]MBS7669302.1 hydrogenase expression/formation protein [Croceicoccus gelatinilyticus]